MRSREPKKHYEKPSITRVRLHVEKNVLQACNSNLPNMTGYEYEECYYLQYCLKYSGEP